MITNGFTYIAVLVFIAALLVWLQRYTKSKFFDYAPPIVLLYLITMILCTLGAWDMEATKPAYSVLKNNLLYTMIFLMLLRCDIRKIIKLGPKMLGGFQSLAGGFAPDGRSIFVFALLWAIHLLYKKKTQKAPSPIGMIVLSAVLGVILWGV